MTQYTPTIERVNPNANNFNGAAKTIVWAPPVGASAHLPKGKVGVPYVGVVLALGGRPQYRFTLSGLPLGTGLSIDEAKGIVSGLPTRAFRCEDVTIVVTDANGTTRVLTSLVLEVEP